MLHTNIHTKKEKIKREKTVIEFNKDFFLMFFTANGFVAILCRFAVIYFSFAVQSGNVTGTRLYIETSNPKTYWSTQTTR